MPSSQTNKSWIHRFWLCLWLPIAFAGCGTDSVVHVAHDFAPKDASQEVLVNFESDSATAEIGQAGQGAQSKTEAKQALPFPNRVNPFEFQIDYSFDAPNSAENSASEIRLFGFVGSQSPKAVLNVGGRTKTLAVGDRWGSLEIVEISPPEVRIRIDGVIRSWSLVGKSDR